MPSDGPAGQPTGSGWPVHEVLSALESGLSPVEAAELLGPGVGEEERQRTLQLVEGYHRLVACLGSQAAAAPQLEPGTLIDGFEIMRPIGSGGSSRVYLARQRIQDRLVAFKVVSAAGESADAWKRFQREAQLIGKLSHDSLAAIHLSGAWRDIWYIAMAYVPGPTLGEVLQELPAPAVAPAAAERARPALLRWAAQVASALALLHREGLVHRDVKPSNIILRGAARRPQAWRRGELPDQRAVLVDYGLVRPIPRSTMSATMVAGTWAYAPREQGPGGARLQPSVDVFALGLTLHDLLCARDPHGRPTPAEGVPALSSVIAPVDPDLEAVVRKATEAEPSWRYADGGEFGSDLDALIQGLPVRARPLTAWELRRRWLRRNPGPILQALGVAVTLAGLVSLLTWAWLMVIDQQRVQAFLEDGDLASAATVLAERSPIVQASWPAGPLRRRLLDVLADPGDPLHALIEAQRRQDTEGALFGAAALVREVGPHRAPLALRVLEASLAGAGGAAGDVPGPVPSLAPLVRLFLERPMEQAADLQAADLLRRRAWALWEGLAVDDSRRLPLATVFSGLATPEDVPRLLDWALSRPLGTEGRRLGLLAVERTLRRSLAGGLQRRVDPALWSVLPDELNRARERLDRSLGESLARRTDRHLWELAGTLALVLQEGGHPVELPPGLPRVLPAPSASEMRDWHGWRLLAVLDPPSLRRLIDGWPDEMGLALAFKAGSLVGLSDDEGLIAWFRDELSRRPGADALRAVVERGIEEGRLSRQGRLPSREPDPDTLMGGDQRYAGGDQQPWVVIHSVVAVDRPASAGLDSSWDFREQEPRLEGAATRVEGRSVQHVVDVLRHSWIRAGQAGRSELRLGFDLPAGAAWRGGSCVLELEHLAAARDYLPFQGEVFLELEVDGWVVTAGHAVSHSDTVTDRFLLPGERLSPGPHEMVLRVAQRSTTTYRLSAVRIGPVRSLDER